MIRKNSQQYSPLKVILPENLAELNNFTQKVMGFNNFPKH